MQPFLKDCYFTVPMETNTEKQEKFDDTEPRATQIRPATAKIKINTFKFYKATGLLHGPLLGGRTPSSAFLI